MFAISIADWNSQFSMKMHFQCRTTLFTQSENYKQTAYTFIYQMFTLIMDHFKVNSTKDGKDRRE